jgi:predicted ATPase
MGAALAAMAPNISCSRVAENFRSRNTAGLSKGRPAAPWGSATGNELFCDYFLALMATALGWKSQFDEGLRTIDDSLSFIERTGQRIYEAEVHRLKGELLLAGDASNAAQAEQSFRTAIEISHRQKAKSWELRARTCLARQLAKQGKRDEARAMLAGIYNWFTEGFDTADLKDAKALLDEVSSPPTH